MTIPAGWPLAATATLIHSQWPTWLARAKTPLPRAAAWLKFSRPWNRTQPISRFRGKAISLAVSMRNIPKLRKQFRAVSSIQARSLSG